MNELKYKLCLFVITMLLTSCKPAEEVESFEVVKLNFQKNKNVYGDFFEEVKIKELAFPNDSSWIGNIDSYKVSSNHIYLVDESQGKKVVKFNMDGSFLGEINSVLDSPDGFNKPNVVAIEQSKNQLLVLDRSMLKLVYYDENLQFLKSEKLEQYYSNIAHVPGMDGFLFFTEEILESEFGYELAFLKSNEGLKSVLHTKHKIIPHLSEAFFFNENSGFYHLPFEDKIYRYEPEIEEFVPVVQVVLDSGEIPVELLNSTDINEMNMHLLENHSAFVTFNGMEFEDRYTFFYHDSFDSYGFASLNRWSPDENVATSWEELFENAAVPVPFASSEGYYYSVGYLDENNYLKLANMLGLESVVAKFPDFREKLFLFKFKLL